MHAKRSGNVSKVFLRSSRATLSNRRTGMRRRSRTASVRSSATGSLLAYPLPETLWEWKVRTKPRAAMSSSGRGEDLLDHVIDLGIAHVRTDGKAHHLPVDALGDGQRTLAQAKIGIGALQVRGRRDRKSTRLN